MRGPHDEQIEVLVPSARGGVAEDQPESGRPPGGKTLLRLLNLLDTAGISDTAAHLIATVVPQDRREQLDALRVASAVAAAPEAAGGNESAPSEADVELARVYAETANSLATVPAPSAPAWRSLGPTTMPNGQTYGS